MEFTKIRLKGLHQVDLPIIGVLPTDDFILKNVDGLGPVDTDVSISRDLQGFGRLDRRQPQGRTITLTVGLNPSWHLEQTPGQLRDTLYGLLTPTTSLVIPIEIMWGATIVAITEGVVKRIEPVLFSKDPSVVITIECIQVYLSHPEPISIDVTGHTDGDDPEDPSDYIDPFLAFPTIDNVGNAPSGIRFWLYFTGPISHWALWLLNEEDPTLNQPIEFQGFNFIFGDSLIINTIPGERDIYVNRAGVNYNLVAYLTERSRWLQLHGGVNHFSTSHQNFVFTAMYYTPQYWGV